MLADIYFEYASGPSQYISHKFKMLLNIDLISSFITVKMFDYIALSKSEKKMSMMNFIVSKMDFII